MSMECCFIEQIATTSILLRVTNVCSECYADIHDGDIIFYDIKACRYICSACQERLLPLMSSECIIEGDNSLF